MAMPFFNKAFPTQLVLFVSHIERSSIFVTWCCIYPTSKQSSQARPVCLHKYDPRCSETTRLKLMSKENKASGGNRLQRSTSKVRKNLWRGDRLAER
ncbi:hypothetical protein QQP08_004688 [Theobroma cacao]|nr:hypothetical protein QQP08_004688 [Theobroma cacao]